MIMIKQIYHTTIKAQDLSAVETMKQLTNMKLNDETMS